MARAKYQVLVIPFFIEKNLVKYCIFYRNDMAVWQFIAGGGEDEDETVIASAKREAFEEANIDKACRYFSLDTQCSIPTYCFKDARNLWGKDCLVISEYTFAVMLENTAINLTHEHTAYEWVDYETAMQRLKDDSNRTALWELDNRIRLGLLD